jgi:predicted metal-dependent phosphoesterase TrpH
VAAGLTALALTDHDNLGGIAEARKAAGNRIELIAGVELSVQWDQGGFHLIVLFLGDEPGPLQQRLGSVQDSRSNRNRRIVERLNSLGVGISWEEVEAEGGTGIGRPHIAQVMVDHGAVDSISEAFDLWLAKGRPAYVERERLPPEEAIGLARLEEAAPILAHPHTLGLNGTELGRHLEQWQRQGLLGMEAYYPEYSPEVREELAAVARIRGLVPSGGSDYHGRYKPGLELGRGYGDLSVPSHLLEELREEAKPQ